MYTDVWVEKLDSSNYKLLRKWRNENREFFIDKKFISEKAHDEWFEKWYKTMITDFMYIVTYRGKYVGAVGIQIIEGIGYIGRVVLGEKEYRRKGIMQQAIVLLMEFFALNTYRLDVLKSNTIAIDLYKKLGFVFLEDFDTVIRMELKDYKSKHVIYKDL